MEGRGGKWGGGGYICETGEKRYGMRRRRLKIRFGISDPLARIRLIENPLALARFRSGWSCEFVPVCGNTQSSRHISSQIRVQLPCGNGKCPPHERSGRVGDRSGLGRPALRPGRRSINTHHRRPNRTNMEAGAVGDEGGMAETRRWLRQNAASYEDRERVCADIDAALARFPALRPKSDVYSSVSLFINVCYYHIH